MLDTLQLCLQVIALGSLVYVYALQQFQDHLERSEDPQRLVWWFLTVLACFRIGVVLLLAAWVFVTVRRWSTYGRNLRVSNDAARSFVFSHLAIPKERRSKMKIVGFFHPYCNAGGGGERVLWTAISAIQRTEPDVVCVVYSGDLNTTKANIIAKVKSQLNISLDAGMLHIIFLGNRDLVDASSWPHFTMIGQSVGSMYLAWEAMTKLIPDLYIDTMGYAFTFYVVSILANIPIGAYVHYPTISTDMLERVRSRRQWHTNSNAISSSSVLSYVKLWYYRYIMYYYARSLRRASFIMVNSSWTKNHIDGILQYSNPFLDTIHLLTSLPVSIFTNSSNRLSSPAQIVYPPCDTREMAKFPLEGRERVIVSVAQFRPEKDHAAQLHSFHELLKKYPDDTRGTKLVLVGGCRGKEDNLRVHELHLLANQLELQGRVELVVNAPYPDMLRWLSRSSIGLSTMVDEHFGINIVEFMAAGVIPVTHASGGPLNDIVVPLEGRPTGYHATTPETFAAALHTALTLDPIEGLALRQRARTWAVQRFSEEEFVKGWNASGWRDWVFGPSQQ